MSSFKRSSGSEKGDDIEIKQDISPESAGEPGLAVEKELVISDEERRLVRKLDWRILPIACLMYLFACTLQSCLCRTHSLTTLYQVLDRSNLGNARLQGLPEDTLNGDPTGVKYDWVFSAFYFSYVS